MTTLDLNARIWHTTNSAAAYAAVHAQTILTALRSGELRGSQRKKSGNWRIHRDDLDAWLRGEAK